MNGTQLIRQATVWQNGVASPYRMDLLIVDGIIQRIDAEIDAEADVVYEAEDLHVSIGWMDLLANLREPGHEQKESLQSGLRAAAAGGFTAVLASPETYPVVDARSDVAYLIGRGKDQAAQLLVAGALTKKLEGKELAELFDMQQAGASAFHNGKHPISDARLMSLALQYASGVGAKVFAYPLDVRMAQGGVANEGIAATRLGLRPVPALAEELMVMRDIALAEYLNVPIHFMVISTPGAVQAVRDAKTRGLQITASVPAHHLYITDEWLLEFDANVKVCPPFRSPNQVELLRDALLDGTIDTVVSDHEPHEIEAKQVEFNQAEAGISAFETAFAAANTAMGPDGLAHLVDALTTGPRQVLGIEVPEIKEGARANLTLFSPTEAWTPTFAQWQSKGRNNPLIGKPLMGRPLGTVLG